MCELEPLTWWWLQLIDIILKSPSPVLVVVTSCKNIALVDWRRS